MGLPQPVGRQSDVAYMPGHGHHVVLGTAGTGKTVMAIHRAAFLANPAVRNSGPVLLVTYTRSLVAYLKHLTANVAFPVTVETYGRFARGYLKSRGKMSYGAIVSAPLRQGLLRTAIDEVRGAYKPNKFFDRSLDFFLAELAWIEGVGISSLDDYIHADRVGRVRPLQTPFRQVVWKIRSNYLEKLGESGRVCDWHNLANLVREELSIDTLPRRYKHIVIDEAQDLTPQEIRSLVDAVPSDGSITLFADYAQQLYGNRVSWKSIGLKIAAEETFTENYRNTKEIARLALSMAAMPHFRDVPDLVMPQTPTVSGAKPTLRSFQSESAEIETVRNYVAEIGKFSRVGVLTRTWADVDRIAGNGLKLKRLHDEMTTWSEGPGIYAGPYHSGKGLEFEAVVLPFCGSDYLPARFVVEAFGDEDAKSREARLLYVGVTRAKTELLLTYTGTLTDLLPDPSSDLWN